MGIFKAFEISDKVKLYGTGKFEENYNDIIDESICNDNSIKDNIKYITISNFVKEVYTAIKKDIDFPYGIYYEESINGVTNTVLIKYKDVKTIFEKYKEKYNSEQKAEESLKKIFLSNNIDELVKNIEDVTDVMAESELKLKEESRTRSNILDELINRNNVRLEEISVCAIKELSVYDNASKTIRDANIGYVKNIIKKYIELRKTSNETPVFSNDEESIIQIMIKNFKEDNYDLDLIIESGIRFVLHALKIDRNKIETAAFFGFIIEAAVRYNNNLDNSNNDSSVVNEVMKILRGEM